jgi:hypothetical protein
MSAMAQGRTGMRLTIGIIVLALAGCGGGADGGGNATVAAAGPPGWNAVDACPPSAAPP